MSKPEDHNTNTLGDQPTVIAPYNNIRLNLLGFT